VIWQIINNQFCAFKIVIRKDKTAFCRNEYNVTGLCNRSSCPLANSRYATVREENGVMYLYIKTIERAHSPKNLWEKIELHHTYTGALGQIDEHLMHWPVGYIHRVKQRLTRLHQYLIRMKKLLSKPSLKVVPVKKGYVRREQAREAKALVAARLDFAIKKELMERLKKDTYGGLYNTNAKAFNEVMDSMGQNEVEFVLEKELDTELEEEDEDDIEDIELGEEEEEEADGELEDEGLEDAGINLDDPEEEDFEMLKQKLLKSIKKKRKETSKSGKPEKKKKLGAATVEIEYEREPANATNANSW